MPRFTTQHPAAILIIIGASSIPAVAQTAPPGAPRTDSAPAKKLGRFGRLRASLLPGTTYAGRLIAPLLTEAQEKGVPGLHVQEAIHEFTGPSGDYPALAEAPANALAARLRTLIREQAGQQSRVADSIGSAANTMGAAIMAGGGAAAPTSSGLQLPPDVPAALRSGRLALTNINWSAGEMALRTALSTELKAVAAEMNAIGGPWRIEVAAAAGDGGKETARVRATLVQNALVTAGLQTVEGRRAVLRPPTYDVAPTPRVEIVRP